MDMENGKNTVEDPPSGPLQMELEMLDELIQTSELIQARTDMRVLTLEVVTRVGALSEAEGVAEERERQIFGAFQDDMQRVVDRVPEGEGHLARITMHLYIAQAYLAAGIPAAAWDTLDAAYQDCAGMLEEFPELGQVMEGMGHMMDKLEQQ